MNNNKYNLFDFFETLKSDANFNTLKERIGNNTVLSIKTKDGKKINIYSAEMFYLLSSEDYKDEGFINAYAKGYHNGNEFIENKTQKALNGFFKSCPEKYIDELKVFYFDKAPNEVFGYKQIATGKPLTLRIELIEKIGFASGVINAIDLMKEENTAFFLGFDDENNEPPQQDKNIKTDEVIKEFKDFFIPDVKIETINNIQTNYKDLIGKKMAFLIYLLETEFKIINYSLNGKNDSRKHFVKSLKSIDTKMQGINKHFEANSTNLSIHKFENDNDYKKIKDFLTKTI